MKNAKSIILGLTLSFISINAMTDELSNQKMLCEFDGKEILIVAPMPDNWSHAQKEKACKSICESIKYAEPMIIIKKAIPQEAVCDTDYNRVRNRSHQNNRNPLSTRWLYLHNWRLPRC